MTSHVNSTEPMVNGKKFFHVTKHLPSLLYLDVPFNIPHDYPTNLTNLTGDDEEAMTETQHEGSILHIFSAVVIVGFVG
jgi:hypothetical protein